MTGVPDGAGGGLANESGTATIGTTTVAGNSARLGGGLFSTGTLRAALAVNRSVIYDNVAWSGGGIRVSDTGVQVTNTTIFGQNVTYTASVASPVPGTNVPTGTVTFLAGSTTLGTVAVDNRGTATLTTNRTPIGNNPLTANYSGDANFHASSNSGRLTVVVLDRYTPGAFDPATANWYLRNSTSAGAPDIGPFNYGAPGWTPVVGDWDGNGTFTVGVVNPDGPGGTLQWFLRNSNSAGAPDGAPFTYGLSGWKPITGDWMAWGFTTIGVVDPATGTWYLRNNNSGGSPSVSPFAYGAPGWTPVTGNWLRPTPTATATGGVVSSSLASDLLVTGLRRTQALDQLFASGSGLAWGA